MKHMQNKAIKDMNDWLDACLSHLPLFTKKEQLREELVDHFCDCLDAQFAKGYDEREAQAKALAALGDPDETGRLLRKVHSPCLTVLLYGMRILILALLLFLAVNPYTWNSIRSEKVRWQTRNAYVYGTWFEENGLPLLSYRKGSCDRTGEAAGREISVLTAWNLRIRAPEGDAVSQHCYVVLRVNTPRWETSPLDYGEFLERSLRVTADGEFSLISVLRWYETETNQTRWENPCSGYFSVSLLRRNLLSCDYLLVLEKTGASGDEPGSFDPDRIELRFTLGDTEFTLPLVFGPRAEAEGGKMP